MISISFKNINLKLNQLYLLLLDLAAVCAGKSRAALSFSRHCSSARFLRLFGIVAVGLGFAAASSAQAQVINTGLFTTTNVAAVLDSQGPDVLAGGDLFYQFTAGSSAPWGTGTALSLNLDVYAQSFAAGTASLGIYSDSGSNTPGALLAGLISGPVALQTDPDLAISASIPLTGSLQTASPFIAGQTYWFGVTNLTAETAFWDGPMVGTPHPVYGGSFGAATNAQPT